MESSKVAIIIKTLRSIGAIAGIRAVAGTSDEAIQNDRMIESVSGLLRHITLHYILKPSFNVTMRLNVLAFLLSSIK